MKRGAQVKQVFKNIGFILGFRPDFMLDNIIATVGLVLSIITWLFDLGTGGVIASAAFLLLPTLLQLLSKIQGMRKYIQTTLYILIVSTIAAIFNPPLIIVAMINAIMIEDFTIFMHFDVTKLKRTVKIMLAPISRRETLLIFAVSGLSGLVAFSLTGSPLSLLYPVISYVMVAYSMIIAPPEYSKEVKTSFIEELSRRVAVIQYIFNRIYMSPNMRKNAKQAGVFGYDYFNFIRKASAVFTLLVYTSIALAPLLSIVLGNVAYILPLVVLVGFLPVPYMVISSKRRSRAGKLSRNLILILSYFAAMKSVAEPLSSMMVTLKNNKNLSKLFGMEKEADLYYKIYITKNDEHSANYEYADSIPEDFFRDTVRTMIDIEENEGIGAAFRMLVSRLRDYTGKYIDRVSAVFNNIGSNVISVSLLFQSAIPAIMLTSNPTIIPFIIMIGGLMSGVVTYAIAAGTLPEMPTEFIHAKQRYRRAAIVFSVVSLILIIIEKVLTPDYLTYELILNVPAALGVAIYYASYYDLYINNVLLEKFSDFLVLFSSSLARHGSVEQAYLELSQQPTFPQRIREEFKRLANVFRNMNIQRIDFKGPYWYKYMLFLSSITVVYGTTPRELYKALSSFMLEFKRFFNSVKSFGATLVVMTMVGMVIMNVVYVVGIDLTQYTSSIMHKIGSSSVGGFNVKGEMPVMTKSELETFKIEGLLALLATALINGFAIGKVVSGTVRDGRYALMLYVLELVLIYIGLTTHFGMHMVPAAASR